jgi:hypothetical protein
MDVTLQSVRRPAVAGRFYPAQPHDLRRAVRGYLDATVLAPLGTVRAVIAPHAGYVCSGPVAGCSFAALRNAAPGAHTVFLLGPAHYAAVHGVGLADCAAFQTPLGPVPVDQEAVQELAAGGHGYHWAAAAHRPEHCLEVELPFLQEVLADFQVVPLLFDEEAQPEQVGADLAARLADDPAALVVVSSDLSHYFPYAMAQQLDRSFLQAVVDGDATAAACGQACGLQAILSLMVAARKLGWLAHLLAYQNSGDTCGPRQEVVGYGAVAYVAPS